MEINDKQRILGTLSRRSRLCLRRKKWKWGKEYQYKPRQNLVRRIAQQENITTDEAENLLYDLRKWVLTYPQYF